jgi:hypothetical protein
MHGVLGWQVGPVPGADTAALEGATIFLEPAENCKVDCCFSAKVQKGHRKNSGLFHRQIIKKKKVCCKTVRFVPGSNYKGGQRNNDPRNYVCFYKKTRNHDLNLRVITRINA